MTKIRGVLVGAIVALVAATVMPTSHADLTPRPTIVRVEAESATQAAFLMNNFDETHNHSAGEIELLLWPGDRAQLDQLGYHYEVVTEDLFADDMKEGTASPVPLSIPGPDLQDYRRLPDYNNEMKTLAKDKPSLVKLFKLPHLTLEGRSTFGVEIGANVKDADGRPVFYMDGVHHAREWPASEYSMLYIHHLVEGFGKDAQITKLLKKARVIVIPIVNVDGFNYTRESVFSYNQALRDGTSNMGAGNGFEGYWRKNRRSLTGVTTPEAQINPDAYGVDPNRNYSYLWGDTQGGSSSSQVAQTYRGEAPFSEPEPTNVRDLILGRAVTGVITNHTYQGSVLRAGGGFAPDENMLRKLGDKMAVALKYRNAATVGYPTTGTTDDWAYYSMGALGFTIEHGVLGFHPAYDREVGAFWKEHMKAFTIMLEASANPQYHSILKGKVANGPAKLRITKTYTQPLSPGNPIGKPSVKEKIDWSLTTEKNGSFTWHITPSKRPESKKAEPYTLTITAGGKSKTRQINIVRGQVLNLGSIRL